MSWYVILLSCVVVCQAQNYSMWRIVPTAQGPVEGRMEENGIYVFYNIPYARAPTGVDKFKAPLPPERRRQVLLAIDRGVICPQAKSKPTESGIKKLMNENCLVANVYVPNTEVKNLSVVVYVHGGAFQVGYGDNRKATIMMASKRIIVVTFNYRLGVHGFLCLGTKDIPGNAGMKDIIALLRWVKENISYFGGNPDDITVSGYSSGATAVDLLILSKLARGLFHKVIIESGANTAALAIQSDPLETAKLQASFLNFKRVDNVTALEKFFKTKSFQVLNSQIDLDKLHSSNLFTPCIEKDVGQEIFLNDSPINILKKGNFIKVPTLYGFTNMETMIRASVFDRWKTAMTVRFSDFLPSDLIFINEEQKANVAKYVKEFYFGELPVDTSSVQVYLDYLTDVMFASPALRSVSLNVAGGNDRIYLYHYSFVDETDPYIPGTKIRGANHCAQSLAIFDDVVPSDRSEEFKKLRRILRQMWHNFIRVGKPILKGTAFNLTWPATKEDRSPYMSFGQEVKLEGKLLERRARFWDKIYDQFYREPIPPQDRRAKKPNLSFIAIR